MDLNSTTGSLLGAVNENYGKNGKTDCIFTHAQVSLLTSKLDDASDSGEFS